MRMIGTIPNAEQAERFSDYLVTRQIENMVEETSAGDWAVWVEHDDHLDRAKGELASFLRNPGDAQYDAADAANKIRKDEQKKRDRRRANYVDMRTRMTQPRQWMAPLTLALIAASCILSMATRSVVYQAERDHAAVDPFRFASTDKERWYSFAEAHPEIETETGFLAAYWFDHLRAGQVWRLFTPMFLHWNFIHLLFNMFWLRDLGGMIEVQRGTLRLAGIVVLCAVLPFIAQYFVSGPGFGGMSGVVYGLFGYVWVKGRYEPYLGLGIAPQSAMILMAWLVICMTGIIGPVANTAHVAGLIVGAALAYRSVAQRQLRRARG